MAKITHTLSAEKREILGSKVKKLRKDGLMPSVIYGKGVESMPVSVVYKEFEKIFSVVGESALVNVSLKDGDSFPILFKNPAFDPLEGTVTHVEMYKVNLKEKITATVPLVLVGEAPALKQSLLVIQIANEAEVECLPTDLPEKIEVDVSTLEKKDDMITMADLNIDKEKVTIKTVLDSVVVKVEEPKEEVIEETPAEPVEVPATAQKSPEDATATDGKATAEDAPAKEKKE